MGLIYDSNEEQQDSNTTREPLLDVTDEPLPAGEEEPSFGLRRRSLSELQHEIPERPCEPELKPRRPGFADIQEDGPEEQQARATPALAGLTDLNTMPDTQDQPGSAEPPCSTETEPVLEQGQPRASRPRLKMPRAPGAEPPQAETASDGLADPDTASGGGTSTPGLARRRSAPSAPVPEEPQSASKSGRRRLTSSAPVPQEPEATTESGRRRLTSSAPATQEPEATTESGRRRLTSSAPATQEPEATTESGRRRLTSSASVPEEPESTPKSGRRRLTSSAPATQEPEATPESGGPPMPAPTPEAEAEPEVKPHRRRLGEDKTAGDESESGEQSRLDPTQVQQTIALLKARQNFPLALIAGIPAMAIGGVLWAVVTVTTNCRLGYMALAVGFLVGGTVRVSGRGLGRSFGWLGAALIVGGCLVGNFLTNCVFIAQETDLPMTAVLEHLSQSVTAGLGLMVAFHPIDLVFYAIAIYGGYRFSFRRLTEARIRRLA